MDAEPEDDVSKGPPCHPAANGHDILAGSGRHGPDGPGRLAPKEMDMTIDYARMNRVLPGQKAALTRAVKSGDPDKVVAACREAVRVWNEIGGWPDAWSRWQIALDDALGLYSTLRLEDL